MATACVSPPAPEEEEAAGLEVATTSAEIALGDTDDFHGFPEVVALWGEGGRCSGVLVTPAYVLTSAHCFLPVGSSCVTPGGSDTRAGKVQVVFNVDGNDRRGAIDHTRLVSGDVITWTSAYECTDAGRYVDLALVRLDEWKSRSFDVGGVTPLHPTGCGSADIEAYQVGYGGVSGDYGDNGGWGTRNVGRVKSWGLESGVWEMSTNLDEDPWDGSHRGDSGGALVSSLGRRLCGITTGMGQQDVFDNDFDERWETIGHAYVTDVGNPAAQQFINQIIKDVDGRYIGECLPGEGRPGFSADKDDDGDFIPDACDPCPHIPDADYVTARRFAAWPDADRDGVPDRCDLCPVTPDPIQHDADRDLVGDECESCTHRADDLLCCTRDSDCRGMVKDRFNRDVPNRCILNVDKQDLGANRCSVGRCAGSPDSDADYRGDLCDNCPTEPNSFQSDADGDSLGDACDLCSGLHDYPSSPQPEDRVTLACSFARQGSADDKACVVATGNSDSTCVKSPSGAGVCTFGRDSDGDGLGDVCDGCNQKRAGFWDEREGNCNVLSEMELGVPYPYPSDECDPVPCARAQGSSLVDPIERDWSGVPVGRLWAKLEVASQILPQAHPEALYPYASPEGLLDEGVQPIATVGVRLCNCELGDERRCLEDETCPVRPQDYDAAGSKYWKVASLVATTATENLPDAATASYLPGAEVQVPAGSPPGLPEAFRDPLLEQPNTALVGLDLTGLPLQVLSPPGAPPHSSGEVYLPGAPGLGWGGVVWSSTRHVQGFRGDEEPEYAALSGHYEGGFLGHMPTSGRTETWIDRCGFLCQSACPMCSVMMRVNPSIAVNPSLGTVFASDGIQAIDLTARVAPELLAGLAVEGARLIQSSEPAGALRGSSLLASLSADGATVFAAAELRGGQALSLRDPAAMELRALRTTPAREGHGAVLSANQRTLFVVGGRERSGSGPSRWTSTVLIHDLLGGVSERELSGAQPRTVLAATYRAEDRALYLLDERGGFFKTRRLLRIDTRTWRSEALGEWPKLGLFDHLWLGSAEGGLLLVTASSERRGQHLVAALVPEAQGLRVEWTQAGRGALEHAASYSARPGRGLTLPVVDGERLRYDLVRSKELRRPRSFALGSCL